MDELQAINKENRKIAPRKQKNITDINTACQKVKKIRLSRLYRRLTSLH
jgi:hypothetical protein